MTIIRLKRSDRLAIHLEFDYHGAGVLLKALRAAASDGGGPVSIEYDRSVTKTKRFSTMNEELLVITRSDSDAIEDSGNSVSLNLEDDTLKYAIARFQKCLTDNAFDPPELCELRVAGKRDADNDLYCILLKEDTTKDTHSS